MELFGENGGEGPKALSVTQLVRRMKNLLEIELGDQWVVGEVSNLRKQGSGHWYFSLKDERAQISCVLFGARSKPGAEVIEDGVKVRVLAEPSIYEARGQLQIIVAKVEVAGVGELQARFEALKRKLDDEGLFAANRKQAVPEFPSRVGLITSGTSAALRDMMNVLQRRAPWVQPILYPVRVQGKGGEREIARAITRMSQAADHNLPVCDVLIVGRGGGSLEDLWNFNEEVVARAISDCRVPVISAVGHEIDFTIADFVADLRAPTPSAAAELAVPDADELRARFRTWEQRLMRRVVHKMDRLELVLDRARRGVLSRGGERLLREPVMRADALRSRLKSAVEVAWREQVQRMHGARRSLDTVRPERQLAQRMSRLENAAARLTLAVRSHMTEAEERVHRLADLLRAFGPESAFERGFSITTDEGGNILRSVEEARTAQRLKTRFKEGVIDSQVDEG